MIQEHIAAGEVLRATVGFCIYCGRRGTSKEHVIPLWAGGQVELGNASCADCAHVINRTVENPMARGPFWSARLYMDLPSRRKHRDPLPITMIEADGSERLVRVTKDANPALLSLCTFSGPHIYTDDTPTERQGTFMMTMASHVFNEEAGRRFGAKYPSPYFTMGMIEILPLAKLMAKIAHGIAVLDHGYFGFNPLLRDFIRSGNSVIEASHFVGSSRLAEKSSGTHTTGYRWDSIRGVDHLVYEITLFAFAGMPVYEVVVGTRPTWTTAEEAQSVWGSGNWMN